MDIEVIFKIAVVLFSIIIHEVSHGFAALMMGDKTAKLAGRLTLNPIKHIDLFGTIILPVLMLLATKGGFVFGWAKPVPYNPYNLSNQKWGDALVALAGPVSNIIIAFFFSLILHLAVYFNVANLAFVDITKFIILMNIILAAFNLVPIPPLDGSKVLFSLLPYKYAHLKHIMESYGFIILLFFIFFLWDYFLNLVLYIAQFLL